jgi:tetratricopeptide (TPR) repeat protein
LVDIEGLPEPIIETILARSEGYPFYIEEFVRMLIEKEVLILGDDRWQVASTVSLQALDSPTSLRALMLARVDRLPQDLQDVLRSAAVIGLQFPARLLEMVERRLYGPLSIAPLLERLTALGLLVERPQFGEQVFAFRHTLTQETVYSSLLRSQRPDLHRTVAECIEALYAPDLSSQAEVLALHYDRARVWDKAMQYALQAGDRARARFSNREAIEYYGRAIQLSQHLSGREPERWQVAIGLGEVKQHVGEYEDSIAIYRAALEEWTEAPPGDRARAMLRLAQVWDRRGDLSAAESWLYQARAELGEIGDRSLPLLAQVYSELGVVSRRRGNLTEAQQRLEQGLALVRDTEHYDILASILNRLGAVHYHRGEWKEAAGHVEQALELRERLGDVVGYARSLNNLGILNYASGDWDSALLSFERAAGSHERIGEVEGLALACTNLGLLYTERGEWDQAEKNLVRSFGIAQRIAHPYELAQAHTNLGHLYLRQGRWPESAKHLDAAIPLYKEAGARANPNLNDDYHHQSVLALEQGQVDTALEWAERSHELLLEVTGNDKSGSVEWGRYERLVGRIALARGDLIAARHHLAHSAALLQASNSQIEVGRTAYWSGVLSLQSGELRKSREELDAALDVFRRLGAAADLGRVEERLALLETQDRSERPSGKVLPEEPSRQ